MLESKRRQVYKKHFLVGLKVCRKVLIRGNKNIAEKLRSEYQKLRIYADYKTLKTLLKKAITKNEENLQFSKFLLIIIELVITFMG
jgi:hypothetical protein